MIRDNLLREEWRKQVYDLIDDGDWEYGWKSNRKKDIYSFWHQHYAGHRKTDGSQGNEPYDCARELGRNAPLLYQFWIFLAGSLLKGHALIRCYANGLPYGCDGTLHTDSQKPDTFTTIYYPHEIWSPNWGGETVFFNKEETDVIGCVYPKANRLLTFRGSVPHVGRGVARQCPVMRITLMFKTVYGNGSAGLRDVPLAPLDGRAALGPGVLSTPEGNARSSAGLGQPGAVVSGGTIPQHLRDPNIQARYNPATQSLDSNEPDWS
jgi:SM-20-related protein